MKKYGKIVKYNGLTGYISGDDSINYRFLNEDLVNKEVLPHTNDNVEFEPQVVKTVDISFNRANYVKVLKMSSTYNEK